MHHNLINFFWVTGICRVDTELKKSGVRSRGLIDLRSVIADWSQLKCSGRGGETISLKSGLDLSGLNIAWALPYETCPLRLMQNIQCESNDYIM